MSYYQYITARGSFTIHRVSGAAKTMSRAYKRLTVHVNVIGYSDCHAEKQLTTLNTPRSRLKGKLIGGKMRYIYITVYLTEKRFVIFSIS